MTVFLQPNLFALRGCHGIFSFLYPYFLYPYLQIICKKNFNFKSKNIWKNKTGGRILVQMPCIYQNGSLQSTFWSFTAWKVSKYEVFLGPYFPTFGLRYLVSLRIQSECGKIRTRKNSVFGYFSRNDSIALIQYFKFCLTSISISQSNSSGYTFLKD